MALAPAAHQLLDAAAGAPPVYETPLEQTRAVEAAWANMGAGEPVEIAGVQDRIVPGPAGPMPARVYTPHGALSPTPVVAYFHGGGWVLGSIETHDRLVRRLAHSAGAVVVSLDYRLAPEHPFPAAVEDAEALVGWLAAHAAELGGDPSRLAVAGDSAGANLAAVVARRGRDAGGPRLVAQVLAYPVTDGTAGATSYGDRATGYLLDAPTMGWFWDCYVGPDGDRSHPDASPLLAPDLSGLPPALVITAEFDPLRDEGEAYAGRLAAAGVATKLRPTPGMLHGFLGMPAVFPEADQVMGEIGDLLRRAFGT